MAVNYTILQDTPGAAGNLSPTIQWVQGEDAVITATYFNSGQGSVDVVDNNLSIGRLTEFRIIANDGYLVSKEFFGICGDFSIWSSTVNNNWINSQVVDVGSGNQAITIGVVDCLPIEISHVWMYDENWTDPSGNVVNSVRVRVRWNGNAVFDENTIITLDIDGDAYLPIGDNWQTFNISVELTDDTPNAKVLCVMPVYGNNGNDNLQWEGTAVHPSDTPGFENGKATMEMNWSGTLAFQASAPIRGMSEGGTTATPWFWIVPNEGYTISRHNFSIDSPYVDTNALAPNPIFYTDDETISMQTIGTSFIQMALMFQLSSPSLPSQNLTDYSQAMSYIGYEWIEAYEANPDWDSAEDNEVPPITNPNYGLSDTEIFLNGQYAGYADPEINNGNNLRRALNTGLYPATRWGGAVGSNAFFMYGDEWINSNQLYGGENSIDGGPATEDYGWGHVWFVDTGSGAHDNSDSIPYPYNLNTFQEPTASGSGGSAPLQFTNGNLNENLCASDWNGNGILVILNGIHNHVPGYTPQDITLKIKGSAMLVDEAECVDTDIEIVVDCIDGFDQNGNPC